jgi:hypothetical protein
MAQEQHLAVVRRQFGQLVSQHDRAFMLLRE